MEDIVKQVLHEMTEAERYETNEFKMRYMQKQQYGLAKSNRLLLSNAAMQHLSKLREGIYQCKKKNECRCEVKKESALNHVQTNY